MIKRRGHLTNIHVRHDACRQNQGLPHQPKVHHWSLHGSRQRSFSPCDLMRRFLPLLVNLHEQTTAGRQAGRVTHHPDSHRYRGISMAGWADLVKARVNKPSLSQSQVTAASYCWGTILPLGSPAGAPPHI